MLYNGYLALPIIGALIAVVGCGQTIDDGNTSSKPNYDAAGGSAASGSSSAGSVTAGAPAGGSLQSASGGAAARGSDAEDGGAGGSDPADPAMDSVRIIRGLADDEYWDLTVVGARLHASERKVVTVRIGRSEDPDERLGSGHALIENGTFELTFRSVWEASRYKMKLAFIDVDDDGTCTPEIDAVYSNFTASESHVLIVTPDWPDFPQNTFLPAISPERECAELNSPWPSE